MCRCSSQERSQTRSGQFLLSTNVAFKFIVVVLENENKIAANRCSNPNPTITLAPFNIQFPRALRNAEFVCTNSRRHTSSPFPRIITLSGLSSLDPSVHVCAIAYLDLP